MEKGLWIKKYFKTFKLCTFFLTKPLWGHRSKPHNLKTIKCNDSNGELLKHEKKTDILDNAINVFIFVNTSKMTLLLKSQRYFEETRQFQLCSNKK